MDWTLVADIIMSSGSVTVHVYDSVSWEIFFTYQTMLTGNDMSVEEIQDREKDNGIT